MLNTTRLVILSSMCLLSISQPVRAISVLPNSAQAETQSGFDTNSEGWLVGGDALALYQSTGGNPGGYMLGQDSVLGGTWYWLAPDSFLGDRSIAYGTNLRFDLKQSAIDAQYDDDDVILTGGGLTLVYNLPANPGIAWTSYSVPLIASDSGWSVRSTGQRPTEAELRQVLGSLDSLSIRGEYRDGFDTGGLDNVILAGVTVYKKVAVLVHGWQGTSFAEGGYSCSESVTKYPAVDSKHDDFGQIPEMLTANGYDVYFAHYSTGPGYTPPIAFNANCLVVQMNDILSLPRVKTVTLIAHSMGGLVARMYVDRDNGANWRNVDQLITLGTPHLGIRKVDALPGLIFALIPGSLDCRFISGTCQLSATFIQNNLNANIPTRNKKYFLVGGIAKNANTMGTIARKMSYPNEGINDGMIGMFSSTPLEWFSSYGADVQTKQTNDAHSSRWADTGNYYFTSSETLCFIASKLTLTNTSGLNCSNQLTTQSTATSTVQNDNANTTGGYTPAVFGVLNSATPTTTVDLTLDGSAATVMLKWQRGDITMSLRSPSGLVITSDNVSSVISGGLYTNNVVTGTGAMLAYDLPNIESGIWRATLTATNLITETNFMVVSALRSPITSSLETPAAVAANQPFTIAMHLAANGNAITATSLQLLSGTVTSSFGWDNPIAGTYVTTLTAPLTPGLHLISVVANGSLPTAFQRQESQVIEVFAPRITLLPGSTFTPLDSIGQSGYGTLRYAVALNVTTADTYRVRAILRAPDGNEIDTVTLSKHLVGGATPLEVDFSGQRIRQHQINGPYMVDLTLFAESDLATAIDRRAAAISEAYRFEQFGGPVKQYIPLIQKP